MKKLPNILTLGRIFIVVPFIACFYLDGQLSGWITFAIFTAAALTDFFDGWIARRYSGISELGRILDPIADKVIVVSALIMILVTNNLLVIPVVAIIVREILVSGLREGLAGHVKIPVGRLGKLKTASQMLSISLLLISSALSQSGELVLCIGELLLWITAAISWISAIFYIRHSIFFLKNMHGS
jgi:cardiolipin synthase